MGSLRSGFASQKGFALLGVDWGGWGIGRSGGWAGLGRQRTGWGKAAAGCAQSKGGSG
jgi:hypothetical protein